MSARQVTSKTGEGEEEEGKENDEVVVETQLFSRTKKGFVKLEMK